MPHVKNLPKKPEVHPARAALEEHLRERERRDSVPPPGAGGVVTGLGWLKGNTDFNKALVSEWRARRNGKIPFEDTIEEPASRRRHTLFSPSHDYWRNQPLMLSVVLTVAAGCKYRKEPFTSTELMNWVGNTITTADPESAISLKEAQRLIREGCRIGALKPTGYIYTGTKREKVYAYVEPKAVPKQRHYLKTYDTFLYDGFHNPSKSKTFKRRNVDGKSPGPIGKWVLYYAEMYDISDDRNRLWASLEELAVGFGCVKRTALQALKAMEEQRWIRIERGGPGCGNVSEYHCLVDPQVLGKMK
jgi:hypothetical protein